jgi:zinc transport system substrate-binding protein
MEIEYDEHIWTSPVNAIAITGIISKTLSESDPKDRAFFEANAASYTESLRALDKEFREVTENGARRMFIVADKFPFRYLAEEYGLTYRAAFSGCSTDTEPSARTIAYLIDRIREANIPAVYYLELSSHRTAEIIEEETGAKPLLLHSCHNVTRGQFDEGVTYLQLMEKNVENLRRGLE